MRLALRILALVSLLAFGLSLFVDISFYLKNPCSPGFLFKLYLVLVGLVGIPPALIGSALAARSATTGRRWGWLAGLFVTVGLGLVVLYGEALDRPPPVVHVPITALAQGLDLALGLTTCGSQSSHYIQAAVVALVLAAAPIALLAYSVVGASGSATAHPHARQRGISSSSRQ